MNDQGVQNESTFVLRRLVESFKVFGKEIDGIWWLPVIGLVLLIALVFVVWMYVKDSRSVRWYWSVPLATTRICVYLLLAGMFLMPAQQLFEREDKRSRVIVVLDVSDSMAQISDDSGAVKSKTRLTRVLDLLSDEQVGFMHALAAKNPVHVYRLGNRLDDESQLFEVTREIEVKLDGLRPLPDKIEIDFEKEKSIDANESAKQDPRVYAKVDKENKTRYYLALPEPQHRVKKADGNLQRVSGQLWTSNDWNSFATYDFKPWLLRGLSEDGAKKVTSHPAWEKDVVGNAEWAQRWHEKKGEGYPNDLSADDKSIFEDHREKLMPRVDVARSLTVATNVPDSLLSLVNREAGNMVQGIVVFSDGQSNLGNEAVLQELRQRSNNEKIPLFTVGIGSERKITAVRITDVQAPEQTPPDEGFKIIIEQDGEGLVGQKAVVNLEIQLPGSETIIRLPSEILYQPGEPPHGQTELLIDPEKIEETSPLRSKLIPKELVEGDWKIRAATPKVEGERFADKEHVSEWQTISVKKKAQRILVMCSAPNRDFQFLVTQLLRDKADMSLLVQNTGGTDGKINLLEDPERQLTHFPTRLDVTDKPTEDPKEKWYNLARYDVIIAFDPDWEKLSKEQILMIQTWVDLNAGGLLYVAGHIHTKTISRPEMDDRYTPLNAILPVLPGDPDLAAAKRTAVNPWRLEFENLADMDFMKLDDELPKIETGWERFFTGREERDEKAPVIRGFYNYFPIREMKTVATPVARYPDPNAIKMPDGKAPPWLAVMQYGQGRTAWVGSSEIWRLRQYKETYFERFWTKMTRYLGQGSQRKQTRRGRILMSKEVGTGGFIRVTAQLLDASLKAVEQKAEPKIIFRPFELDKYPAEIEKLQGDENIAKAKAKFHEKYTYEYRMGAKKSAEEWGGYFQRAQLAAADKFPTGTWRAEVEIPSSTETLKQKFSIRQSNPELDVTRPDFKALYQMASSFNDVNTRVTDTTENARVLAACASGPEGKRLSFKFDDREAVKLIPKCMTTDTKTVRNRGAVEDYWDKGLSFTIGGKPQRIGYALLLCVFLLSVEWLTRKLLKLA